MHTWIDAQLDQKILDSIYSRYNMCMKINIFFFFRAVNELQETEFRGQTLQARLTERRSPRRSGGVGLTGGN